MSDDAAHLGDPVVPEPWRRSAMGVLHELPGYRVQRAAGRPDWLLVLTLDGCGVFRQGPSVVAAPVGAITLVRPGAEHDYGVAPGHHGWSLAWAHVTPRAEWPALLDWPVPVPTAPGIRQVDLSPADHGEVAAAMTAAAGSWRRPTALGESFALNDLERALLLVATARRGAPSPDPRIDRVLEFIDAHLDADLSVRVLAGVAGTSESWFSRVFAAEVGSPPQRHVERQRMVVAAQLLEATDQPVGSVARAVGFEDPLYFSTRFRRTVGVSPTKHRERHRSQR